MTTTDGRTRTGAPTHAPPPTAVVRLAGLHVRLGEAGLRLALLQGLWLVHVLLGGVVLGLAPATAAVVAVLRRDRVVALGWAQPDGRPALWREFHGAWRRELRAANALGGLLGLGWAVWLYDLWLLRADGGAVVTASTPPLLAAALTVLLWVLGAVLLAVTAVVPVLAAHLDGGALVQLRRAVAVAVGRPLVGLGGIGVLLAAAWLYTALPGVGVVFGVSLPALVLVRLVWRVLPAPDRGLQTVVG